MRCGCILLVVVAALLTSCADVSASSNHQPIDASNVVHNGDGRPSRFLRSTTATESDSEDAGVSDEERVFDDPAITKYLSLFKDWARNGETPESVYQYFNLAPRVTKAYKSGKWARLLKNEKYIMYRKYEKYLHLRKIEESQVIKTPL